jgi:hypothetical protein
VSGWFKDLFRIEPEVLYPENYSPHVSTIKYKQLDTGKNYEMSVGVFGSAHEGDLMVPEFSYVVHEVL